VTGGPDGCGYVFASFCRQPATPLEKQIQLILSWSYFLVGFLFVALGGKSFPGIHFIFSKYSPSRSKVCWPPSMASNSLTTKSRSVGLPDFFQRRVKRSFDNERFGNFCRHIYLATNFPSESRQRFQPSSRRSRLSTDANFSCVKINSVCFPRARNSIVTSISGGSTSPNSSPLPSFSNAQVKTRRSGSFTSR